MKINDLGDKHCATGVVLQKANKNLFIVSGFLWRSLPHHHYCEERKRRGNPCGGTAFQKIGTSYPRAVWKNHVTAFLACD
jgi:hypothetical protein